MLSAAENGSYGGYIGFIPNFFFRAVLQIGNLGSTIIFIAAFIVGVLLTFEFSIVNLIRQAKPEIRIEKRKRFAVTDEGIVEVPDEDIGENEEEEEINIIKPNQGVVDDRESDETEETEVTDIKEQGADGERPVDASDGALLTKNPLLNGNSAA